MNKKETEELSKELEDGNAVVHTKTEESIKEEIKEFGIKQRNAHLGAVILATATFYKFEELQELGATKMNTKHTVKNALKFLKQDINGVFDIVDKNDANDSTNKIIEDGVLEIEKVIVETLKKFSF